MKNDTYDITINVTAHKEGYLLHRSLIAINACKERLEETGKKSVIHINLDNTDEITKTVAEDFKKSNPETLVFFNTFGDLSASRNFLVSMTDTKYTLFVDGDDLFSENFLSEAYHAAEEFGKPCVVSAENIVKFSHQVDQIFFREESTLVSPGIKTGEFEINSFVSQNLVTTSIYKDCIYEPNTANYGYEDWHWNTKVIEKGYEYLVAPRTFFFYRQKPDNQSLLRQQVTSNTVIRRSPLFSPNNFLKFPHEEYYPPDPAQMALIRSQRPLIDKIERLLRRIFTQKSLEYRGSRKIYRTFNKFTGKTTSHNNVKEVDDSEFRGLKKYTFTEQDKELWHKMNKIEPLIRIDPHLEHGVHIYRNKREHSLATAYYNFCKEYKDKRFTDVIFVPWINSGGADMAMLRLCKVLVSNGRHVLMITTNGLDSQWEDKVREIDGLTFIQSHDPIFKHLDHNNIKLFFLRLVQNWDIKTMTVMNSAIGFELIDRFGEAIHDAKCKTIVHSYAMPTQDDWIIDAFPSYSLSLNKVDLTITDSATYKYELMERYGIPEHKIKSLMIPISQKVRPKTSDKLEKRILYANRIAREKQPDIAIETLKILSKQGIEMDMYGMKDLAYCESISFDELIESTSNVAYKGVYSGVEELDFNRYDICFMPSLYEGTPNIMLESVAANLYIVGTETGGMAEVVASDIIGQLLLTTATSQDFATTIQSYYDNTSLHSIGERMLANKTTLDNHSHKKYEMMTKLAYEVDVQKEI